MHHRAVMENDPWRSWKVMENFQGKTAGTLYNVQLVRL